MSVYTIKKGNHYRNLFPLDIGLNLWENRMIRQISFSESCFCYPADSADNTDISKAFGFSNGYHMENSARLGWNYSGKNIDLYAYMHIDGVEFSVFNLPVIYLCSVGPNQQFQAEINVTNGNYVYIITLDGKTYSKKFPVGKKYIPVGYNLGFYFGGSAVCPQEMKSTISRV